MKTRTIIMLGNGAIFLQMFPFLPLVFSSSLYPWWKIKHVSSQSKAKLTKFLILFMIKERESKRGKWTAKAFWDKNSVMNGKPKQITSSLWSGRKEGKNKVEKKKEEKKNFYCSRHSTEHFTEQNNNFPLVCLLSQNASQSIPFHRFLFSFDMVTLSLIAALRERRRKSSLNVISNKENEVTAKLFTLTVETNSVITQRFFL